MILEACYSHAGLGIEKWSEIHTAALCKAVEARVGSRCLNLRGGIERKGSKTQPHRGLWEAREW